MIPFERLHPALQHHIVNSLGWRELRPFQEEVIAPILDGQHLVVLAPTAGGKTEAALFPLLSRMLSEEWHGLSTLYLCPIKALLNNLDVRLQRYCTLLGRRAAVWHGDIKTSARRAILREPPDCLLTTPESLEVMLVSQSVDAHSFLSGLRAVVVDEIHAFAGDDRGWHLISVLERVSQLAGRDLQRIGLSATVGNPEVLLDWLVGSSKGSRQVVLPTTPSAVDADVQLDYVGSLENAAVVISRLHRGEKRLVFVDSRSQAEELGLLLRHREVTTFVTHSSLSVEQRHQAEEAFANRDDCVIVATSVLELGIDVGDLDRVIQIDSPSSVSSLLQRMGRTGRRAGSSRNCLFLATKDESLLQAAGLIKLWESGFVEPIEPPPTPYHVLAQQLMALILQNGGVGRQTWFEAIRRMPAFAEMPVDKVEAVVAWMLEQDFLWDEEGILGFGRAGEERYGRKNFMELLSVFLSPPLFSVLHGRRELGFVDELTFLGKQEMPRVLLLGGRAWQVNHIDWSRKVAHVEASQSPGRSRWKSAGRGLSYRLCQSIKQVLQDDAEHPRCSKRAHRQLEELRSVFAPMVGPGTTVLTVADETEWWTFGGWRANSSLVPALSAATLCQVVADSFSLTFRGAPSQSMIDSGIEQLRTRELEALLPNVDERALVGLKFSDCLPPTLALSLLQLRQRDSYGVGAILGATVRWVTE